MKRAFTLIELLVVIAIIAILAAILFPVFAQAKAAAKKTAQLAQYKQAGTAGQIYLGDADDTAPMTRYTQGGGQPDIRWAKAFEPYMKSWPLLNDRTIQDPFGVWNPTPAAYYWWANWETWPTLAYNAEYLNNAGGDCSKWGTAGPEFGPPISMTSIQSPSGTVMFVSVKRVGISTSAYASSEAGSPAAYNSDDSCNYSDGGWGVGSYGDKVGWYPGNPTSTGTYATPYTNQGIVIFTDSSAKSMPAGKLAAGTDWKVGAAVAAIHITDRGQYIWDTQQ